METTVLTRDDIAKLVGQVGLNQLMDNVIGTLKQTFETFDDAATIVRQRDGFAYHKPFPGVLEWMPVMQIGEVAIVKMVGYNPKNPTRYNVPTIISTISLYDICTGHLMALIDGTFATALRTGAASAIASQILARRASEVVGLVGCGAQAVTQLHALSRIFNIKQVLIYDIEPSHARSFLDRSSFMDLDVQIVPREILEREADIICTATSVPIGAAPVISDEHLKSWVHINAVGSDLPKKIELPLGLLKRSLVSPDYLPQALIEGECQQLSPEEIGPSLIELVRNEQNYASFRDAQTVFDSTGFALEDKAVLQVLLSLAEECGVGRTLPIESIAGDPMNPYSFCPENVTKATALNLPVSELQPVF